MSAAVAAPEPALVVADSLRSFGGTWSLCGGWAVDAWLGRVTRDHADVDVAMFMDEQARIWHELRDWSLVAHDTPDASHDIPWDGHDLGFPAHLHADRFAPKREIQLNERESGEWLLQREPRIALPFPRFAVASGWGIPTMAPEAVLFYKGADTNRRPHDEQDFDALGPHLDAGQRAWLQAALRLIDPGHSWLERLA